MSNKITEPGNYTASPVLWGSDVNDNGKSYVTVKFDCGHWWKGWLVGGAIQFTSDALNAMGFKGANPNDLNEKEYPLNKASVVDIKVEWMTNKDGSKWLDKKGLPRLEVSGVWPQSKREVAPENVQTLKGIDLRGYLAESKKTTPTPETTAPHPAQNQQMSDGESFASETIPF